MASINEFLFTTVKANNFGDENEISVTCRTCQEPVNLVGSYETILERRREWIENHSCELDFVAKVIGANIHESTGNMPHWSSGCIGGKK
jgi:hypothetical protein